MKSARKSVHFWIHMTGRGWMDIYAYGTPREIEKWRVRQLKIRDVIQVKACEGCVDCEETKKFETQKEKTA